MFGREARWPINIAYGTKQPVAESAGGYATGMEHSFFMYGDAVGTKVSGRSRQGGRSSEVAVKRGSTVATWTCATSSV